MAPRTYWVAPVPPMNFSDGSAFTGLSLLDISPVPARPMPNPELGSVLRLRANFELTSGSATPTLTLGFYWGGIAGTAIASATGIAIPASVTAGPLIMEYEGEFRVLGASGSLKGQGRIYMPASLTTFSTPIPIPQTQAARTVTVNTINGSVITCGANWSSATGSPSITCTHLCIELVGLCLLTRRSLPLSPLSGRSTGIHITKVHTGRITRRDALIPLCGHCLTCRRYSSPVTTLSSGRG